MTTWTTRETENMTETQLIKEEQQLSKIIHKKEITPQQAIRLSDIWASIRKINSVRSGAWHRPNGASSGASRRMRSVGIEK